MCYKKKDKKSGQLVEFFFNQWNLSSGLFHQWNWAGSAKLYGSSNIFTRLHKYHMIKKKMCGLDTQVA